jgi:hypothetical protein
MGDAQTWGSPRAPHTRRAVLKWPVPTTFTVDEAADLADVKPSQLKLWLSTGQFTTSTWLRSDTMPGAPMTYFFSEQDIERLVQFAKTQGKRNTPPTKEVPFVDDGAQENFTVAQVASLWRLSRDTIQRLFENEPGVVVLGNKNPRGKRRRITLRIPRAAIMRVKKRRSNPA